MTLRTVARQTSLSMEFSRQKYCSGLPFPSPGDVPDPGIESGFPALQADSLMLEPPGKPKYRVRDWFSQAGGQSLVGGPISLSAEPQI